MRFRSLLAAAALFAGIAHAAEKPTIPTTTSTPTQSPGAIDQAKAMGDQASEKALVNINKAPANEIEKVPGLTPEIAKQIVAHRPYASLKDLSKVKGLKPDLIAKTKPYVTAQ